MFNKCYACNHTIFEKLEYTVSDMPELDIYRCKNCNLIFLENFDHIDENFYKEGKMNDDYRVTIDSKCKDINTWIEETKLDDHRRFNFLKNDIRQKDILDFGSGNGGFLNLCSRHSKSIAGLELDQTIADLYKSRGIKLYTSMDQIKDKYDIVTAFHVIEHLKDPIEYLRKIKNFLNTDGSVYLEFPNSQDALISYYKNKDFCNFTFWSCHLMLFNSENIDMIAQKAGYTVIKNIQVQRYPISNHMFWLSQGKPGGHNIFSELNSVDLNDAYVKCLVENKMCDTVLVELKVTRRPYENIC